MSDEQVFTKDEQDPTSWMLIANGELDVKEIEGKGINERIVEYHSVTSLGAKDDAVPWCASFVCWVLQQAGYPHTRSAAARSYIGYGAKGDLSYGDIVVTKRKGGHHVGFVVKHDPFNVWLLGGNQSDMVCIRPFAQSQVIAIRKPEKV